MNQYLVEQYQLHPSMQPQDVFKMIYQSVFGADHILQDIEAARRYFLEEYEATEEKDIPVEEEISDRYSRLNIAGWKYHHMDKDEMFSRFVQAAGSTEGTEELFMREIEEARETLKEIWSEEQLHEFDSFAESYLKEGIRAVHHSSEYREKEHPAYRIARRD